MPDLDQSADQRQWCVIANSHNAHDFEVWGPYTSDEADVIYERLADRTGKLTLWPMSRDWDVEEAANG
jgi:hypothetical protein